MLSVMLISIARIRIDMLSSNRQHVDIPRVVMLIVVLHSVVIQYDIM
jgi:hypothetical protein